LLFVVELVAAQRIGRTWLISNRVSADSRCRLAMRALATVSAESVSDFATYLA